MKVSGIEVQYRRSVQPKQYESAEAQIRLDLQVEDDESVDWEQQAESTLKQIQDIVHRNLGLEKTQAKPKGPSPETVVASGQKVSQAIELINKADTLAKLTGEVAGQLTKLGLNEAERTEALKAYKAREAELRKEAK